MTSLVINDDDNPEEQEGCTLKRSEPEDDPSETDLKTLAMVRMSYGPNEGRRIFKNLFGVAVPFVLLFSALTPIANIQSSLNPKNGLGPYTLATMYLVGCISSLFFLSFLLSKVTCKLSMVLTIFASLLYVLAQFFPSFATLMPAAVLMGVGGGLLWTSMSNYVSRISQEYAYFTGQDFGVVLARFFGIFFLLYLTSGIWGNLILAATFSATTTKHSNVSDVICGAGYCPARLGNISTSTALRTLPPRSTLNLLFGSYFICILIGALIMYLCVDSLSRYGEGCHELQQRQSGKQLLLATFNQMRDPYQLLLIPFIFFSTFQTGFFAIDFTAGYITCAWGIEHIGQIMICFSISAALSSFVFSRLIKFIGRIGLFSIVTIAHLVADVFMLRWIPTESEPLGFFVIACIAGTVEGVLSAQITAFTALVFRDKKEPAFNNQRLWQGIGFITAYINATLFCIESKLYLIMAVAVIGFGGYLTVEIAYKRKIQAEKETGTKC